MNEPWYFSKISLQSRKFDDVSKKLKTSPEKNYVKLFLITISTTVQSFMHLCKVLYNCAKFYASGIFVTKVIEEGPLPRILQGPKSPGLIGLKHPIFETKYFKIPLLFCFEIYPESPISSRKRGGIISPRLIHK